MIDIITGSKWTTEKGKVKVIFHQQSILHNPQCPVCFFLSFNFYLFLRGFAILLMLCYQ